MLGFLRQPKLRLLRGKSGMSDEIIDVDRAYDALSAGDYSEAFNRFSYLATLDPGNIDILLNLGWLYQTGFGVAKNLNKSIECYEKAAEGGATLAHYYLGRLAKEEGRLDGAVKHFEIAAEKGYPSAAYWLGTMYLSGIGVKENKEKAKLHLKNASKNGHIFAKRDLALAEIKGSFGSRNLFVGIYDLITSCIYGIVLSIRDPNNHKIN